MRRKTRIEDVVREALKRAKEIGDEEAKLFRELGEGAPNKYLYLGYTPVDIKIRFEQ